MQLLSQLDYLEVAVRQREAQIRAMLSVCGDDLLALKARFLIGFPEGFTVEMCDLASNTSIPV